MSLKIASSCSLSGMKTGLFISPHISSFRERIQINGTPILEDDVIVSTPPSLYLHLSPPFVLPLSCFHIRKLSLMFSIFVTNIPFLQLSLRSSLLQLSFISNKLNVISLSWSVASVEDMIRRILSIHSSPSSHRYNTTTWAS